MIPPPPTHTQRIRGQRRSGNLNQNVKQLKIKGTAWHKQNLKSKLTNIKGNFAFDFQFACKTLWTLKHKIQHSQVVPLTCNSKAEAIVRRQCSHSCGVVLRPKPVELDSSFPFGSNFINWALWTKETINRHYCCSSMCLGFYLLNLNAIANWETIASYDLLVKSICVNWLSYQLKLKKHVA